MTKPRTINLLSLLSYLAKHEEAMGHCRKALELAPDWALAKKKLESLLNRPRDRCNCAV
ncbi:MAG: hypothetical protein ACI8T1_000865 [Verrucomicrobiales bacterium]|jgi:hypothetical protein